MSGDDRPSAGCVSRKTLRMLATLMGRVAHVRVVFVTNGSSGSEVAQQRQTGRVLFARLIDGIFLNIVDERFLGARVAFALALRRSDRGL